MIAVFRKTGVVGAVILVCVLPFPTAGCLAQGQPIGQPLGTTPPQGQPTGQKGAVEQPNGPATLTPPGQTNAGERNGTRFNGMNIGGPDVSLTPPAPSVSPARRE
jgi:hypothetical protein